MHVQVPEPPPELAEWSQNTSLGVFSGLMFGGVGQWLRDRQAGNREACLTGNPGEKATI